MSECFFCEKPEPCGCPLSSYGELPLGALKSEEPFPAEYLRAHEWGWTTKQADEFFVYFDKWLYCDRETTYLDKATGLRLGTGKIQNRKGVAFAVDTEHSQVRGTADEMEQTVNEDHCDGPVLRLSEAPQAVLELQKLLSAKVTGMYGYSRCVNYISVIKYPDENAQINWHKHGEDNGIDTPVLIVSTGAERPFHLALQHKGWKYGQAVKTDKWERVAEHGSLIVLPASFNDTHLHAILKESEPCGTRISVNTKCLVKPRVFSIKSQKFPRFAKYVGCRFERNGQVIREGTIYGNDYEPFKGHRKPIAQNEDEFRLHAEKKMLDPEFRAQAIKDLRGKHLLCWCYQDGEKRAPFCHARVWLEIVNRS